MSPHVTLYVKSEKTAVRTVKENRETATLAWDGGGKSVSHGGWSGGGQVYIGQNVETRTQNDYVLSEEQQRMVEDVQQLASKYGFSVEVVDLTKRTAFSRFRLEHHEKIKTLPALVTDSGEVSEGVMAREQIEAFLSKRAKTNQLVRINSN